MPKNANAPPLSDRKPAFTSNYKIGKTTYVVSAFFSEKAADTIERKIEKLIMRDVQKTADNSCFQKNTG